jgi:biopolymer transport protein ExbD
MQTGLRPFSEINVTSVADVAITLLIIFIIAGSSGAFQKTGLQMNLPRTSAAKALTGEGVVVTMNKDGKILVGNQTCRPEEFTAVLTRAMQEKGATQVYLRADAAVPYGLVIDIVGQVKEAGYENLGLVAEPKPKRPR